MNWFIIKKYMILQFKCERLHYFINSHYIVNVYKDKLTIGNKVLVIWYVLEHS